MKPLYRGKIAQWVAEGKYFGGLKYYYNHYFDNKREANARAGQLRKGGNLARVVPAGRVPGWVVWDRPAVRR